MSALFIIFLTVSIYYYILYVFSIISVLVGDTSSSSSTDDFDAVSRIEVFVSDSVLIISPFLLVHFTKKVTFFEGFHLILELLFFTSFKHSNKYLFFWAILEIFSCFIQLFISVSCSSIFSVVWLVLDFSSILGNQGLLQFDRISEIVELSYS